SPPRSFHDTFCVSCRVPSALSSHLLAVSLLPGPPRSPLFPYTTLFRSSSTGSMTTSCTAWRRSGNTWRHPIEKDPLFLLNVVSRSEEHTSELQSRFDLVCRLLLEKKNIFN